MYQILAGIQKVVPKRHKSSKIIFNFLKKHWNIDMLWYCNIKTNVWDYFETAKLSTARFIFFVIVMNFNNLLGQYIFSIIEQIKRNTIMGYFKK